MARAKRSKSSAASTKTTHKASSNNQQAFFPVSLIPPTIPKNIKLETLLNGNIWVAHNFLTRQECQNFIQHVESLKQPASGGALEYACQRGTRYLAARECFRLQQENPEFARRLFERFPTQMFQTIPNGAVACNPNIRFYKYCKGHAFGKHYDERNILPDLGFTRLTVLIYLSECGGGATRFYDAGDEIAFAPQTGSLLVHLHGNDCLLHEADVVTNGIKYVLRTDLVYRYE